MTSGQSEANARWRAKPENKRKRASVVRKIKLACLAAYSDGKMECRECGYSNVDALTLDHINNDGTPHRKLVGGGFNIYWDLKRRDFPSGFQVLCCNCNWLKEVARRRKKYE